MLLYDGAWSEKNTDNRCGPLVTKETVMRRFDGVLVISLIWFFETDKGTVRWDVLTIMWCHYNRIDKRPNEIFLAKQGAAVI